MSRVRLRVGVAVVGGLLLGLFVNAQSPHIILPKGTHLRVLVQQPLSTKFSQEGQQFTAALEEPLIIEGQTALPKDTLLVGTVSRVKRPGRFRGKAELFVCFDYVRLADGREEPLLASITGVDTFSEKHIDREGAVQGGSPGKRGTLVVLGGGAAGAGIGTVLGGGKGAAIGGAAGTLAGIAGVFLTRGQDIDIPSNTGIEVVLDKPLVLPSGTAAASSERSLRK